MWEAGRGYRQGQGLESGSTSTKGFHPAARLPTPGPGQGPLLCMQFGPLAWNPQDSWSSRITMHPGGLRMGPWAGGL